MRTLALLLMTLAAPLGCTDQPTHLLGGGSPSGGSSGDGASSATSGGGSAASGGSSANGGASGAGGEAPQPATFSLSLSQPAATIELRDSVDVVVTVAANGYVGTVTLDVAGLPADVDASLAAPSVTLSGSGSETVTLTLSSASDSQTGDAPYTVTGTVPSGSKDTQGALTIEPVLTVEIPANLADFISDPPDTTAFGAYPTLVKALPDMNQTPITVRFHNNDDIPHEIHADGTNGFFHSQSQIGPGQFDDDRQITGPGTYDYYPHDLGTGILGRIKIQ